MRARRAMRRSAQALATVSVCAIAVGCGSSSSGGGGGGLAKLQKAKSIDVAVVANPPYSNITASGKVTGMAPDLATIILKRIGITKQVPHDATYGNAVPGLVAGRWDMIDSELDVIPARCSQVSFGNSLGAGGDRYVVKPGNPLNLHTSKDLLKHPGIKVGILAGAPEIEYLEKNIHVPASDIVSIPDDESELADFKAGRVQAVYEADTSLTGPTSAWQRDPSKAKDFEITSQIPDFPANVASFAFPKSDNALREAFNAQLTKLVKSGEFFTLAKKYGFSKDDLIGAGQAAPVTKACKTATP